MICKNCGKEFEGNFCPECGTRIEQQELKQCPNCGTERIDNGKFCVNCGYNFEEPTQSARAEERKPSGGNAKSNNFLKIFAKVYRWLLAGGMLFVGIVSLLCLTAPVITENFLGESVPLCTGFDAISGKDPTVPNVIVNTSVTLLVLSILALIYGGAQLFLAIKRPYSNMIGKKKYVFWGIDGAISLILIILGAVMASQAGAEDLMDGKLGAGFAMCIVMGVLGLVCLGARVYYELKVFKWEDTGLSQEQIAKATEHKPIDKAKAKKIAMRVGIPTLVVAILVAIIVPSVLYATNIFRASKVDKINIGDSQQQVVKILGEPYEKTDYRYEYYSKDYIKIADKAKKLEEDALGNLEELLKLEKQIKDLTYQYICVDFDSDRKVSLVFLDAERRESKESKKVVNKFEVLKDKSCYITKYNDGSFQKNKLESKVIIPDGVTSIGRYAFSGCSNLTSIEIPSSVTSIGSGAFSGCSSLTSITVDISNTNYKSEGNCIIEKSTYALILGCKDSSIPKYVKSIGEGAFSGCNNLTSIEIPSSVKSINYSAFYNCSKLANVTFEGTSHLENIEASAFYGCSSLASINVPSSVKSIGNSAFYSCSALTSIEIPSDLKTIGFSTFDKCSNLKNVTFGENSQLTSIGYDAFKGCSNLISINIPDGVTHIGYRAFKDCSSLTSVVMPSNIKGIGEFVFSGCSSLISIEISEEVTCIGSGAFYGCSSLTSIEIPQAVTSIGSYAFYNCNNLTIYCEAESKPSGWRDNWNSINLPVVWEYKK